MLGTCYRMGKHNFEVILPKIQRCQAESASCVSMRFPHCITTLVDPNLLIIRQSGRPRRMPAFAHPPLPRQFRNRNTPRCTIIVPGKFDALHLGHRALAEAASHQGSPTLLSFSGMAALLRWPPRHPVVAASERKRILAEWSTHLPKPVNQRVLPFSEIRDLSGEQFLHLLQDKFHAGGIVCGKDWRFGSGASCGVDELQHIAPRLGMRVTIVPPVVVDGDIASSTRVRDALNEGDVDLVARLLGRVHRVVGVVESVGQDVVVAGAFVNAVPADGSYSAIVRVLGRTEPYRTAVEVKRDGNEAYVLLRESDIIYCAECEIYIDFIEQLS